MACDDRRPLRALLCCSGNPAATFLAAGLLGARLAEIGTILIQGLGEVTLAPDSPAHSPRPGSTRAISRPRSWTRRLPSRWTSGSPSACRLETLDRWSGAPVGAWCGVSRMPPRRTAAGKNG